MTWNQIFERMVHAADMEVDIVHVPSEVIAAYDPGWGAELLGDKAHSVIFDNTKIKRVLPDYVVTIPFARGAEEIMAWYDADSSRQVVDEKRDQLIDDIIAAQEAVLP